MADKTEFLQAIDDAILDADSLERFINGDDTQDVLTRLSVEYPTLQKALKDLFGSGGVAGRFKTLADLQASPLVDGDYAVVADDADNKNGIYIKAGGEWAKSKYDTHKIVENKLLPKIHYSPGKDLIDFVDDRGLRIARFDENGNLFLIGLEGSVQDLINNQNEDFKVINISHAGLDLFVLMDKIGLSVVRVDNRGEIYIKGFEDSLQTLLKNNLRDAPDSNLNKVFNKNQYTEKYKEYIVNALLKKNEIAPTPNFCGKQKFSIGTRWIDDIEVDLNDEVSVPIRGYDPNLRDDIGVVHPNVFSFETEVLGYKYWMVITPYTNTDASLEIPYLYGTNDPSFTNWELVDGAPQPFEEDPVNKDGSSSGHLSDCGITYDAKTGDIVVYWRESLFYWEDGQFSEGYDAPRARKFNGKEWSEAFYITDGYPISVDRPLSYAIVFNEEEGLYYMYFCSKNKHTIQYQTSADLHQGEWSEPVDTLISGVPEKIKCWHMDAKIVGDKVVILIHQDKQNIPSASEDCLILAISSDFHNFILAKDSIHGLGKDLSLYKGTFEPFIDSKGEVYLNFLYTTNAWELKTVRSNIVKIGV